MKLKDLWKEKDVTLSFEAFPKKKTVILSAWPWLWRRSPA